MDAGTGAARKAKRAPRRSRRAGGPSSVLFLPHVRHDNLPAHSGSFVGREQERTAIVEQIAEHRIVSLVGPGGVGKTTLALRAIGDLTSKYDDGVWLAELADLAGGDAVAGAVLAVLPDVPDRRAPGAPVDPVRLLADRHLLLVLDNCEHVRDPCAAVVTAVLQGCPDVSVLATSREPLGVTGEQVVRVEPLRTRAPGSTADAPASESARLFAARASEARPGFRLTTDALPAVEELCRRLDGLPLALELAAARLTVLSPAEILARLDDDGRLLSDRGTFGRPARHRSLRAVMEWSFGLLTAGEAALLMRLSVLPDRCDLAAAEAVCAGGVVDSGSVLDLLASLVGRSLVVAEAGAGLTRYRMLEVVRGFARAKLREAGEADRWAEAHARWCVVRAEDAARRQSAGRAERWVDLVDRDHAGFTAALVWARDRGRADIVLRLGAALGWFWEARGQLAEGVESLRWGLAEAPDAAPDLRGPALRALGILTWLEGDAAAATSLVDEAAAVFRAASMDADAEACACLRAFHLCARPAQSITALEAELARTRDEGDPRRLASALVHCGNAHFFAGDAVRSRECFEACLDLPRAEVDVGAVVDAEIGRGRIAVRAGELAAGKRAFAAALEVAAETEDDDGRSAALAWLGEVCRIRGDLVRARDILIGASALAVRGGSPLSQARCQLFRARVEAADGEMATAGALYSASLAFTAAAALPYHRVRALQGLAEVARATGGPDAARRLAEEALTLGDAHGDRIARASSLTTLARLAHAEGDGDRALALAYEAFDLRESAGDAIGMWDSLEHVAELAASNGRVKVAALLTGSAQRAREAAGCVARSSSGAATARDLPGATEAPRRGAWSAAVIEGMAMSPAEAVANARRGRVTRVRPPAGWASLTSVERRVADLAADDLTNPAIGLQLGISGRTVQAHLTHVFRKLGVANRRELVRAAQARAAQEAEGSTSGRTLSVVAKAPG